jgi:hypothetical protein
LIAWPSQGWASLTDTTSSAVGAGTLAVLFACFNWAVATNYLRNVETTLDVMTFTGVTNDHRWHADDRDGTVDR